MLKLKHLFENFELARECMELYGADADTADEMMRYFRISSNAIYPFRPAENPAQVCFLRLSPEEEKPFEDVASELDLINWLRGRGYPAMKPVPMKNGLLCDCVETEWGRFNVSCFERVPGESLEDMDCPGGSVDMAEIVSSYGKALGHLHRLTAEYPEAERRRDHRALMDEVEGRLVSLGAPEKVLGELAAVKDEVEKLWTAQCVQAAGAVRDVNGAQDMQAWQAGADCKTRVETFDGGGCSCIDGGVYGLIHYDFEADNVLYDVQSGQIGVIDFDDAIRCFYALDVARAIDSLDDVIGEAMSFDEAQSIFMEGYRSEKAFTEEQGKTLPLMRRLVRLQEYATILHVLSEKPESEPEWMTELVGKLKRKLAAIEEAFEICV